jgi:myo-inositol-1-phosphate synthase
MGKKIKVAIVGVGNCASALVQGIYYYQKNQGQGVSGLMFEDVGGYKPWDIEVVAAWDIDARKVGKTSQRRSSLHPTAQQFLNQTCQRLV